MPKKLIGLLVCIIVVGFLTVPGLASPYGTFEDFPIVRVLVDGEEVEGDVPAVNLEGRTLIPLRFVSEELGAEVGWEEEEYTATVEMPEKEMTRQDGDGWRALQEAKYNFYIYDFYLNWYECFGALSDSRIKIADIAFFHINFADFDEYYMYQELEGYENYRELLEEHERKKETAIEISEKIIVILEDELDPERLSKIKEDHEMYLSSANEISKKLWKAYDLIGDSISKYGAYEFEQWRMLREESLDITVYEVPEGIRQMYKHAGETKMGWKSKLKTVLDTAP